MPGKPVVLMLKPISPCSCGASSTGLGRREAEVAVSQARRSVVVHEAGISTKELFQTTSSLGQQRGLQRSKLLVSAQVTFCVTLVLQHALSRSLPAPHGHLSPSRSPDPKAAGLLGADKSRIHQGTGCSSNQTGRGLRSCGEDGACLGRGSGVKCVRKAPLCCVWLLAVQGREAAGAIPRKACVTALQASGQSKHNSTACLGDRATAARL